MNPTLIESKWKGLINPMLFGLVDRQFTQDWYDRYNKSNAGDWKGIMNTMLAPAVLSPQPVLGLLISRAQWLFRPSFAKCSV